MILSSVCPVCQTENDLESGMITCSSCGAFLTDHTKQRKIIEANNKKYKDIISAPSRFSENPFFKFDKPQFSTESLSLDKALGRKLEIGSRVEIFGLESCGKTTLALQIVAQFQKRNGSCLYIDVEHTFDPVWAKKLGVDLDNLYVSLPLSGTQAIDIIDNNCELYNLIILDTVAACAPAGFVSKQVKIDSSTHDVEDIQNFAGVANLMTVLQAKVEAKASKARCTLIFLNQGRDNIVAGMGAYGIKSPGGHVMKHFATHRIELSRISGKNGTIKQNGVDIGFYVKARVRKNKGAPDGGEAEMEFIHGKGFQKTREYINLGIECGYVKSGGAWFTIGENKIQGFESLVEYFENEENRKKLEEVVDKYLVGEKI